MFEMPYDEIVLTLDPQGGNLPLRYCLLQSGTSPYGRLPNPVKNGYNFSGWYTTPSGGEVVTSRTIPTRDATYYAHWTIESNGGSSNGAGRNVGSVTSGTTQNEGSSWIATKPITLNGVLHDVNGNVIGVLQLKVSKPNAKKHNIKISGNVILLDGKKYTIKSTPVNIPPDAPISANLSVKGLGALSLVIGADGFEGAVGGYTVAGAKVGGNWTRTDARVYTAATSLALPPGTIEELLPDGEPVRAKGGKWVFDKAASIKYAKGALSGYTDPKKPNLSAMKLTYTPKTGLFKGSFKLYALQGGKLKKFTVKVTGVVVDGEGAGVAKLAKPAATWNVRVQ